MYERLRDNMVREYVEDAGISDLRVIEAMRKIPRHLFVETALAHQAYNGSSLPIGFGQTISHPTTVALMTQALDLKGSEKVLEVGTGSGYQAAVLAEMGVKVFSIERIPQLARKTQDLLEKLGYHTVAIKIGDGSQGWNEHAPFHRIIVTASAPEVPDALISQLDCNGRLIMPVGEKSQQKLKIIIKTADKLEFHEENWRSFVPLIQRERFTG